MEIKIGYFFNSVSRLGDAYPCTEVIVRPLANTPGNAPAIKVTLPLPEHLHAAALPEIAAASIEQARSLVPESSFAQWAANQQQQPEKLQPLTSPDDAAEQLNRARLSF